MKIEVIQHTLKFRFQAGTSRGILQEKDSYFIKVFDDQVPSRVGIGECGPLPGLSPDLKGDINKVFNELIRYAGSKGTLEEADIDIVIPPEYPAVRFALETALLDWQHGGKRLIFENGFFDGTVDIPINGLVWMGDKKTMLQRIQKNLESGYDCIKIKVGAISHEDELELLRYIRYSFSANEISIRLDANGAYVSSNVWLILDDFAQFDIHSIEQPVLSGNWEFMADVCAKSPIPVALDEELIGVHSADVGQSMLDFIKPAFVVLKPTLHGGCSMCTQWIKAAEKRGIGWWITSALESNIGLNAIAQFVANYHITIPQGLGTGQLFTNNIPSPLKIRQGRLAYSAEQNWDLSIL